MIKLITNLISLVLNLLYIFGGIVGGIWLLIVGEWKLLLLTFITSLIIPFVYSIITMPFSYLLMLPVGYFKERKRKMPLIILGSMNLLISCVTIVAWVMLAFFFMMMYTDRTGVSMVPLLLYGYSVTTGPFIYMASKESDDSKASKIGVYLAQISYVILAILFFFDAMRLSLPIIIALIILLQIYLLKSAAQEMDLERLDKSDYSCSIDQ